MEKFTIETSSYSIIQNGEFHSTDIIKEGKNVCSWSDNYGINCPLTEEEIRRLPKDIKDTIYKMKNAQEKYEQYMEEEYIEGGFNNFTAQGFYTHN